MARWLKQLQEFSFELVHFPGDRHKNADSMSRWPTDSLYLEHQQELAHQEEINQSVTTTVMQQCSEGSGSDPQGDIYNAQLNDDTIRRSYS